MGVVLHRIYDRFPGLGLRDRMLRLVRLHVGFGIDRAAPRSHSAAHRFILRPCGGYGKKSYQSNFHDRPPVRQHAAVKRLTSKPSGTSCSIALHPKLVLHGYGCNHPQSRSLRPGWRFCLYVRLWILH